MKDYKTQRDSQSIRKKTRNSGFSPSHYSNFFHLKNRCNTVLIQYQNFTKHSNEIIKKNRKNVILKISSTAFKKIKIILNYKIPKTKLICDGVTALEASAFIFLNFIAHNFRD